MHAMNMLCPNLFVVTRCKGPLGEAPSPVTAMYSFWQVGRKKQAAQMLIHLSERTQPACTWLDLFLALLM